MAKKDRASLNKSTERFEEYFKEDLEAIEEELTKSKEYSSIIDREIEKLAAPALGSNKGSTRYLIDIIENAVALQTQRQGLRKDKFAIKKAIMDYAQKFADDDTGEGKKGELEDLLSTLLSKDKNSQLDATSPDANPEEDKEIDDAIDDILSNKGSSN